MNPLRRAVRGLTGRWREREERRRLAPLYDPDPRNLDPAAHLREAVAWIKRAQDTGTDRGVSYGVKFGGDFDVSYPETTGYICQTFVQLWRRTGEQDLLARAIAMGEWEAEIQMPEGAVMGGKFNANPTPAIFNTGMVLLGWAELIHATGEALFRQAAERAGEWMIAMQEPDGNWIRGHSGFAAPGISVYNVKAAWGLCAAGLALERADFTAAAVRNAEYCLTRQEPNGWFDDCCLTDARRPLLHTLAYTMQGLLEIGRLTGRADFIAAARRTANAQIQLLAPDGFLPGRQDEHFRPAVNWCCLTGSAQVSIVLSALARDTGEARYGEAARLLNRYLMARHDIRNPDPRLRGGLAGSWPTDGEYGRFMILNWATKFLVDALVSAEDLHRGLLAPRASLGGANANLNH